MVPCLTHSWLTMSLNPILAILWMSWPRVTWTMLFSKTRGKPKDSNGDSPDPYERISEGVDVGLQLKQKLEPILKDSPRIQGILRG